MNEQIDTEEHTAETELVGCDRLIHARQSPLTDFTVFWAISLPAANIGFPSDF
jgi:hypothetical protein